jgi:2,5-furandicarboxylate decarboxylase 1
MKDLRSYLKDAEAAGRLHKVSKEVDPLTNLATLSAQADRAILYENVKGYDDWSVVSNLVQNRDMEKVVFGVENREDVVRAAAAAIDLGPQEHLVVKDSPAKEVVWEGDDANLSRLPAVFHSELDGGPYVGSALGIVVDPDTGLHNSTWPRTQVSDGKNCPFLIFSPHVGRIAGKYAARGEPMPMALSIGSHPAWEIAASLSIHHPHCGELDYAGNFLGEEAELVKCDSINIDVPASSEIIVEGEVVPGVMQDEGPFGNYLGTYCSGPMARDGVQKALVYKVNRITTRKNPIYRHVQSTVWTEHQRLCMLPIEGSLFTALTEMGIDVHDVYMPSWGGCSLSIIQMTPHAPGDAKDALMKALTMENTTLSFMGQVSVAVNRDVNIYDARDVLWAMTIRANWGNDTTVIPGLRASPLMPSAEKVPGAMFRVNGKAMVDATCLPARDDDEWWEINRAWPMGQGSAELKDFVDDLADAEPSMQRIVGHEEAVAPKPGKKPTVGGGAVG